ncbi:hypothetical protein M0R45_016581 [Rubus argutus]|uniref:Reverse transcriptase domain-containing protein n=1 Tax=Rubus argutus TaxID=59490 RepID=A0AAW1XSD5_RUBAR
MLLMIMFKTIFWNARGAGGEKFRYSIVDLIKLHPVDILAICEPKVQFVKASKTLLSLGFNEYEIFEANGFSGGIWLLWNSNKLHVDVIDNMFQAITIKVSLHGGPSWILSTLYASPTSTVRSMLWNYLDNLMLAHPVPWLFIGDFNELYSGADKNFGTMAGRIGGLKRWVDRNALIDLGFIGSCYTWTNNRIKERLDRAFCTSDWRICFPEAFIRHLPRLKSDHCPILLQLHSNNPVNRTTTPFRFQAMWFTHEDFSEFVSTTWTSSHGNFLDKSKNLSQAMIQCNFEVFGNIFQRKKRLLARIGGIQKASDRHENSFLINLEAELIREYETLRDQENLFWKQKSRDKWLQEGDKNTKYFHLSTLIRRRKNKIEGLFDINGAWHTNTADMMKIAVSFFQNLFSDPGSEWSNFLIPWLFPRINDVQLESLCKPVEMCEIKSALFSIGGLKTPGIDGFPALFYQTHWNLYATDIFTIVHHAFSSGVIPAGLNHKIISLIPKVTGPQSMVQFRPISLCNTIYKVISKMIVARIRPLMKLLISPNQVSYVRGRHISDNILVAQELLFKFKKSSGMKGFIAWKIDLSKAYDKLSWQFIESVLYEALIPQPLVKLIMSCISSTSFQICFNGQLTESFQAQRGIRQGDPLSPYIFVLCMEKLSHLIQSAVDNGDWKAVKTSQSGPRISHLFFADDLMLFAEASHNQAYILKDCLDKFCSKSGQSVSFEKSLIFCSPNTGNELATDISNICGSPLTDDLGKYLGMPLIHSRVNKHTYSSILDKAQNRLASWKSKVLSMVGRLTLIHSVTAAIPLYAMQTARLPMSICNKLDKINRDFLWGDSEGLKKPHLVNWDTVCLPKLHGGLGIKKTTDMNQAMLAKAGWRLFQKDAGLWASIYQAKYLQQNNLLNGNYSNPQVSSSTWKSIVHGCKLLNQGLIWRIGNGQTVYFWTDIWITSAPLCEFVIPDVRININDKVCNFWTDTGWNIDLLSSCLPLNIVDQILNVPPGFDGCGDDTQIWGETSNDIFYVKSAYTIVSNSPCLINSPWKFIWKLEIPPKLKTFVWVLCHGKLLTNAQRVKRKFTLDDSCPICHQHQESLVHLFRDCPAVLHIWKTFSIPTSVSNTFHTNWFTWLKAHLWCKTTVNCDFNWNSLFVFICWFIWKWRNKHVFESNFRTPQNPSVIIIAVAKEWFNAQAHYNVDHDYSMELLCWSKPPTSFFKLNIDGTRQGSSGKIGAGGVIRCSSSNWIKAFQVNLGIGDVLDAETWSLFYGLKLALKCSIDHLLIESDSAILVKLILQSDTTFTPWDPFLLAAVTS